MTAVSWRSEVVENGQVTFRVGRTSAGMFVAEWPGEARLVQTLGLWSFEPEADLAPARAEKLSKGAARAVRRYFRGEMSFHASAVAIEGNAIIVLGPSGAGKSTMAATMCEIGGASLLADDVLAVERNAAGLLALPTEAAHWLATSPRALKQAVPARHEAKLPAQVAAIVVLDMNESPSLVQPRELKGRASMLALSHAHITLPTATREERTRDFIWLANVCGHVPMFTLLRRCGGNANEVASAALRLLYAVKT